jgi:hypothetical protein
MKKIAILAIVAGSLLSAPAFAKGLNLGLGVGAAVAGTGLLSAPLTVNTAVAANVTGAGALLGKNGLVGGLLKNGLNVGVGVGATACGCN